MPRRKPDIGKVPRTAHYARFKKLQKLRELNKLRKTKGTANKLSSTKIQILFKRETDSNSFQPTYEQKMFSVGECSSTMDLNWTSLDNYRNLSNLSNGNNMLLNRSTGRCPKEETLPVPKYIPTEQMLTSSETFSETAIVEKPCRPKRTRNVISYKQQSTTQKAAKEAPCGPQLGRVFSLSATPSFSPAESHPNDFKVCFLGNELYPQHTLQAPTAAGLIKQLEDRLKSLSLEYAERTRRKNTTSGRQCQACAEKFATYTSYIDHIKVCPIQCKCGQLFNDSFYFLSHTQSCNCVENDKKPSSSVDAT